MKTYVLLVCVVGLAVTCVATTPPSSLRNQLKKQLTPDFADLNRGKITLSEFARRVRRRADRAPLDAQEILLAGVVRVYERTGETNEAAAVSKVLEDVRKPFVVGEKEAVLHLGRFGDLTFASCPTGEVDLVLDMTGRKVARVRVTHPFWITKYPLSRRTASFYQQLDPSPTTWTEDEWETYVNLTRGLSDELTRCMTRHFADRLPSGYVVRLPTLAEWELAFHAGAEEGPFANLQRSHHGDEIGRRLYYDYDREEPRRQKLHNAWGIGDWCPQEKVFDVFDARSLVRFSGPDKFFLVRELPAPVSTDDPVSVCTNEHAVALTRMPSWARWKAATLDYGQDWCPLRLVIAPKLK